MSLQFIAREETTVNNLLFILLKNCTIYTNVRFQLYILYILFKNIYMGIDTMP